MHIYDTETFFSYSEFLWSIFLPFSSVFLSSWDCIRFTLISLFRSNNKLSLNLKFFFGLLKKHHLQQTGNSAGSILRDHSSLCHRHRTKHNGEFYICYWTSFMVAKEVTFRKLTVTAFVCVGICVWYNFHRCPLDTRVHICAEQNIVASINCSEHGG